MSCTRLGSGAKELAGRTSQSPGADWQRYTNFAATARSARLPPRVRRSSGNVFRDLGFDAEEAENLRVRADLMIELSRIIEARGLTQAAAAKLLGVTQPRVSDLVRGKIDRFSIDGLVEMLGHAGMHVSFVLKRRRTVA